MRFIFTWIVVILMFGLGIVLGVAGYHYWRLPHLPPMDATAFAPTKVTALGRLEPADGIITIGSPIPDRLQCFRVGILEGAHVSENQALAELASRADRQLEYDLVCQQIREAEQKKQSQEVLLQHKIQLEKMRKKQIVEMEPFETAQQKAKVEYLNRQVSNIRKNSERLHSLPSSAISDQELEQQDLLLSQAESELKAASEALLQLGKSNALKCELIQAQIDAGQEEWIHSQREMAAALASLNTQKEIAKRRLDQTLVYAPCSGEILKIYTHAGEIVGSQPILQIADTTQMVVKAEVYETDIDRVQKGQKAVVWSRVWPNQQFAGRVKSKENLIAPNRILDTDPTAKVDRRVVEVTIELENPTPARNLIHHQVYVEIDLTPTDGGSS